MRGRMRTLHVPKGAWGARRPIIVPNPAAGDDWQVVVPGGFEMLVEVGTAVLKCSEQDGERKVALQITDGNLTVWQQFTGLEGKASETLRLNIGSSCDVAEGIVGDSTAGTPMPDVLLEAGWTIAVVTSGIQTEDQWEDVVLRTAQFDDGGDHTLEELEDLAEKLKQIQEVEEHGDLQTQSQG